MHGTNEQSSPTAATDGGVSAAVKRLLCRQVSDRGIVVWYDPQKVFGSLAQRMAIEDCRMLRYEAGFFRLRQQLEPRRVKKLIRGFGRLFLAGFSARVATQRGEISSGSASADRSFTADPRSETQSDCLRTVFRSVALSVATVPDDHSARW